MSITVRVQEYVPLELGPEQAALLADTVAARCRALARDVGASPDGPVAEVSREPMVFEEPGGLVPAAAGADPQAWLVTWAQHATLLPEPPRWEPLTATPQDDGSEIARPDGKTMVAISHQLSTMAIDVTCHLASGELVFPQAIVPITGEEVEVTVPAGVAEIVLRRIADDVL